jgi:hypothetical protein
MASANKAYGRFVIDGQQVNAPVEWQSIEALATFDKEAVQANISLSQLTFVNAEATKILDYITQGLTGGVGIFEGLPIKIDVHNDTLTQVAFDGIIDLTDNLQILERSNKVICKIKLRDEIVALEEKLQALSFGYLESQGEITQADYTKIDYIVQKQLNLIEVITTSIAIYMLSKELITMVEKVPKDIGNISAHFTDVPPNPAGSLIYTIVVAALDLIYSALVLTAIIKLGTNLLTQLIPVKRKARTIKFKTALTKVCSHLGYGFQTNIPDLDVTYYVPSNYSWDQTDNKGLFAAWKGTAKGIPSSADYGYNCAEFFELAKKLVNGKYAIIGNNICLYNVDDAFWIQQSTYTLPSVLDKTKTFNTSELVANRLLSFDVDFTDEWTISNYQGTSYEVICKAIATNNIRNKNVKGLEEIRFGVSLGSRKYIPNPFEASLLEIAQVVDNMTHYFGGSSNFQSQIQTSIGLMIVGNNNYSKPKVVKCDNSLRLVARSQWSAKYIYNTYYTGRSFVGTVNGQQYYGQKEVYTGVKIPFSLADFVALVSNSYGHLPDGTPVKITSCKYRFSADYATVDYFIRKPYTKNLTEIFIEPSNQ